MTSLNIFNFFLKLIVSWKTLLVFFENCHNFSLKWTFLSNIHNNLSHTYAYKLFFQCIYHSHVLKGFLTIRLLFIFPNFELHSLNSYYWLRTDCTLESPNFNLFFIWPIDERNWKNNTLILIDEKIIFENFSQPIYS